jgi:outer membrane protein OmpA-like peptidoglycan-associated protein
MNKFTLLLCSLMLLLTTNVALAQQKKKKTKETDTELSAVEKKTTKPKSKAKHVAWDAGLLAGTMFYFGETHCRPQWYKSIRPGGGLFARYNLNDKFAVRGNFETGLITGNDDLYADDTYNKLRQFSFKNNLYSGSLLLEWEPFGGWRYGKFNKFHRMISPYVNIGAGYVFGAPNTNFNVPNTIADSASIVIDQNNNSKTFAIIPFGMGLKYDLNKSWTLGVEGGFRIPITNADYLDGISEAGNPEKRDWFNTANISVGYRFPYKRDADKDGIPDDEDPCPDEAGTKATKGCPDTDGDGVADKLDACAEVAGLAKFAGCPDSDGDGVPDKSDNCPSEKGSDFNGGCPDTDEDGIVDKDDKCPTEKGEKEEDGCPLADTDKDGTIDKEDKCPQQAGPQSNMGCPVIDSTATGVASTLTTTTNSGNIISGGDTASQIIPSTGTINTNNSVTEKIVTTNGKTVTKNNVIIKNETIKTNGTQNQVNTAAANETRDLSNLPVSEIVVLNNNESSKSYTSKAVSKTKAKKKTKSKTTRTKTTNSNTNYSSDVAIAPVPAALPTYTGEVLTTVTAEDEQLLKEAIKGIQFETGKSVLKKDSYATLSQVAGMMRKYPSYVLRITGHTDNAGGDDLTNVKLSVARARAVYNYMVKKGINYEQLNYRGCGDGNPVDSNETESGRYNNRRVEFDMLNK